MIVSVSARAQPASASDERVARLGKLNPQMMKHFKNLNYKRARELAKDSLHLATEIYGPDAKESWTPLLALANASVLTSSFDDGLDHYYYAMRLTRSHFGDESAEMDAVVSNMVFYMHGKWEKVSKEKLAAYSKNNNSFLGYELGKQKNFPRVTWPEGQYPDKRRMKVVVKLWVDETGKVTRVKPLIGDANLVEPVIHAALKTEFEPTEKNGKPIPVTRIILFSFTQI